MTERDLRLRAGIDHSIYTGTVTSVSAHPRLIISATTLPPVTMMIETFINLFVR